GGRLSKGRGSEKHRLPRLAGPGLLSADRRQKGIRHAYSEAALRSEESRVGSFRNRRTDERFQRRARLLRLRGWHGGHFSTARQGMGWRIELVFEPIAADLCRLWLHEIRRRGARRGRSAH